MKGFIRKFLGVDAPTNAASAEEVQPEPEHQVQAPPAPEETIQGVYATAAAYMEKYDTALDNCTKLAAGRIARNAIPLFNAIAADFASKTNDLADCKNALADAINNSTTPPEQLEKLQRAHDFLEHQYNESRRRYLPFKVFVDKAHTYAELD